MRFGKHGLGMLLAMLVVIAGTGCAVQGARKTTFTIGTTVTIEDVPEENADGDREYRVGLDDESSLLNAIVGKALEDKPEPANATMEND